MYVRPQSGFHQRFAESGPWYPPAQEHRHSLPKGTTNNGDTESGKPQQLSLEGSPGPDKWGCGTWRETCGELQWEGMQH